MGKSNPYTLETTKVIAKQPIFCGEVEAEDSRQLSLLAFWVLITVNHAPRPPKKIIYEAECKSCMQH